jgi:FkbH-like protein
MKIAVISDVTFEPILKQIGEHSAYKIDKYIYADQIVPELLNAKTILDDIDILIIYFDSYFYRYSDAYIAELLNAVKSISGHFPGNILLSNNLKNGRHGSILKTNIGQQEQVIVEQESVIREILQTSNIYFYDVNKLFARVGVQNAYNFKLGFLYQMPYTKDYISLLSSELISFISFISNPEKKAIFVDCDNTLWNGILGEDGLNGIHCDRNAKGVLFFQFQEFLLEKKKEGFILGICSKNNEEDVKEAFEKLKMPLKWKDFLVKKVNWLNKSDNLKEAAKDLNIGLDSIIFIDDNDFEIQLVNSMLPEVYTRKLVNDYNAFLLLSEDFAFKRKRLTKEDLEKNELYFAEQQRINIKESIQSFEEYLESLAIKLDITVNNESDLERLSQLTEKTNQFNFNKEPYSVSGLKNFLSANNLVYGIRVSDKFGDYGLVGLILIKVLDKQAILQNFLLSCRALGRLIEDNFFSYVLNDLEKKGIKLHEIIFKESPKNAPAKSFFDKIKKVKETFLPINI